MPADQTIVPAELRQRAARYRQLAAQEPESLKRDIYLDMAQTLDKEADAIGDGAAKGN